MLAQQAPPYPQDPGPDYIRPEFKQPETSPNFSTQSNSLSGQWTYRAKVFGGECFVTDEEKTSIVTLQQTGNQFTSNGGVSFQARGPEERTAIGNGTVSGKQIRSQADGLQWVGTISADGNSITGTATCSMGGGGTGTGSFPFTMSKGVQGRW